MKSLIKLTFQLDFLPLPVSVIRLCGFGSSCLVPILEAQIRVTFVQSQLRLWSLWSLLGRTFGDYGRSDRLVWSLAREQGYPALCKYYKINVNPSFNLFRRSNDALLSFHSINVACHPASWTTDIVVKCTDDKAGADDEMRFR